MNYLITNWKVQDPERINTMNKPLLRAGFLIMFGMLIIGIIGGCGDDSPEVVTDPSNPTTSETPRPRPIDDFPPHTGPPVLVDPAAGSDISPNTQFFAVL